VHLLLLPRLPLRKPRLLLQRLHPLPLQKNKFPGKDNQTRFASAGTGFLIA
jgi:hypothetical protein